MSSFAWSWSSLSSFESCPKKHWHLRVKKDVTEVEGEPILWGKQVHAAMSRRIDKGTKLPPEMPYEIYIDDVLRNSDRTLVVTKTEQQLAVTEDMTPCQYYDKQVDPWLRVVADVLKVRSNPGIARIVDWKTGKGKFHTDSESGAVVADEPGQLALSAAVVMAHYPEVDVVWSQYYWLQEGVATSDMYIREDLPAIWAKFLPRVDRMEKAYRTTEYLPKPSGLCVRHCPVTGCPYHGKGNR